MGDKSTSQKQGLDSLRKENATLKLLCGRLAEWVGLPVGPLEETERSPTFTLVIELPNGAIVLPVDIQQCRGIWHQFGGQFDDPIPTIQQERIEQAIQGRLVRTLHTYYQPEKEHEQTT